nr:hypothetical protein [uncultured Rhodopila sp.]
MLGAFVLGFGGLDILAHGLHDRTVGMAVFGLVLLLPSLLVGFYAARWIGRRIRVFFS